jgi:hypothetical protein
VGQDELRAEELRHGAKMTELNMRREQLDSVCRDRGWLVPEVN